jgi:putative pyruvate formate lyase activating enzyme
MPQILKALLIAQDEGLSVPIVYNTSGYELPETIAMLDGIVDVYLADMRYSDPDMSKKYSGAPDYPRVNQASVREMHRQVGILHMHDEIAHKGLIIRHLVLPQGISGTENIMRFLAQEVSEETYVSLMSQYFPCHIAKHFPAINRRLTKEEFADAEKAMEKYGLHNGWTQESGGLPGYAGIHIKPSFGKDL